MNPANETTSGPLPHPCDAVVIGGGITGLATAHALARTGRRVHVLESAPRLGGAVITEDRDGFLCEGGPNSMLVKSAEVWRFIEELGLGGERVEANPVANKRFLVKNGRMVALPQSPLGGITTPLYTPVEKLRLLAEPFIRRSALDDESVTAFVTRRMGRAFLEYGISALVSGIFAGDPDRLSLRHAFPKVWNLEQTYGSLIGGAVKLKRARKRQGIVPFKRRIISFRAGLRRLTEALSRCPGMAITTRAAVTAISRTNGTWRVNAATPDENLALQAGTLVVATPLAAYPTLPFPEELKGRIAALPAVDHPPLSTLVLGYRREQVAHPLDGFGVLMPRLEQRFSLGCIFSSTLFPGRAPEGMVSLMCFIGGVQQPDNARLPTPQLVEATVRDLAPLLGLRGDPVLHAHTFWPLAIPQYNVGYAQFLDGLAAIERDFPGLHLRGNFRGGPGLSDCLDNALQFAANMA